MVVVWRGRVNLFWVTFMPTGEPPSAPAPDPSDTTAAASLPFSQLAGKLFSVTAKPQVKVQLHWAEYFQGKWSDRISTDLAGSGVIDVPHDFDPHSVYIHVSKEMNADEEGAVRIHLDFNRHDSSGALVEGVPGYSFRVTSKNCQPDLGTQYWEPAALNPYSAKVVDATLYGGSQLLQSIFVTHIGADGEGTSTSEPILHAVTRFELLLCANRVAPALLDAGEPRYWEAGALVSPFFFKDKGDTGTTSELTFFVQPSLTETTMREREGWAVEPVLSDRSVDFSKIDIPVLAQVPLLGLVDPGDPVFSLYRTHPREDWVTNPGTAVAFGSSWIGQVGAVGRKVLPDSVLSGPAGAGLPAVTARGFSDVLGSAFVGPQGLSRSQLQNIKAGLSGKSFGIAAAAALKQNR